MNAAQIEQLKKQRTHFTPRQPNCPQELCWCGICHCQKCQNIRRARRVDPDAGRGPTTPSSRDPREGGDT
jgi:hypothetical protein